MDRDTEILNKKKGVGMKRLMITILLTVLLVVCGLGSTACAQANRYDAMFEQKLVGMGFYGTEPFGDRTLLFRPSFVFTNPDGVSKISIERISIFAENGEVWYDGPLLHCSDGKTLWTDPMEPHETRFINAFPECMPMLPDLTIPLNAITIEIVWSSIEEGLALTGWQQSGCLNYDAEGNLIDFQAVWETQMVNME